MNAPAPLHALHALQQAAMPIPDTDPQETAEWREAFMALAATQGQARARYLLDELARLAREQRVSWKPELATPYVNTVGVNEQPVFPGDLAMEERLASLMRWNALAMVVRANQAESGGSSELGGHIASYASAADLFETGFNHFFHAREGLGQIDGVNQHRGDLVFFQPHSAPGVYARAYLESRLNEKDLGFYRQELSAATQGAQGLSSYPHPYLMPDFWQFPTGSMGIGPISSIYHARFMHYLTHRRLLDCTGRKVWGVFGDGEMDEPESMSALTLAAREGLDNLVWVVNCNLQRLDGPVRGNGRIIDELEKLFAGAGWNVIKLVWGSDWDGLFARDITGALTQAFAHTVDGQMQTFAAKDGRFNRDNFFGQNEELARLAQGMTDEQIDRLKRGGHDLVKIHAAYAAAANHTGQPTVILAHTKKGYGMGSAGQGKMTTHSQKKFDESDLLEFRNRFNLPLSDEQAKQLAFYKPAADSPEMQYLHAKRAALGGYLPKRETSADTVPVPALPVYANFALAADGKEMSTTMAFVRMLGGLLKDASLGPRIVPIVADEARTFGMANLFKQVGIYSSVGQKYAPEDIGSVLSYREALDGQILEEGISEAGALASWTAAATSYSVHGLAMLPFYIYYSMFGFQRVGDQIWAAADQRARGFLLGATSGRTTLGGEGLQHQDGSSHLVAATIPNCKAYDPAFACELAVIIDRGMQEMMVEQQDVFYYVTLMNENYAQPDLRPGSEAGIVRGCYKFNSYSRSPDKGQSQQTLEKLTLLGSGAILTEVIKAAQQLAEQGLDVTVYSVTSWSELARDGAACQQRALQGEPASAPFIAEQLKDSEGPIIAATDYVRAVPESIRAFLPAGRSYLTLGTDGFGRSDTRAALRGFFGVDASSIVQAALHQLKAG
ncbi:MAG TPA: alpha-ketoglutarate dehydrogenase [Polaromonas sp.]|uniref:alpha-ketoglutarate dehydrogenase n=2 Tax=Polaromonas TaxID=52972 RepID=UPI000BD750DC|nr:MULTISPECIES: alpha-ketoglutarate dehydrogenase [unclassified Polaromonas]OYY33796.1 MAG: pyruvate dehydrogenase (acetyl-transferring), homodimeric type [Polaromonas sp. 35-63-35]OYZ19457.1 MAG: pyruvate dehydrogenase (acetyl-transferring), homodimeric type [Polaromonas sp. 16-63-31]OYZ77369.1 MAG: pyruvate dehydrogenase (acetyl-transferring), homodimeric type [Polaromonas sp. 24-63-21]OZA48329.1 MAG: pyruvate dehydrogenase (acetyl-transferring), homodimeric type [Polaromonas sp. 17-63-33]O